MRKIWYVLIIITAAIFYAVFTSQHLSNVHNAWMWSSLKETADIIRDLIILYIAHRIFNKIRTHEICESDTSVDTEGNKKIGSLCVGIMGIWVIAIAIVIC